MKSSTKTRKVLELNLKDASLSRFGMSNSATICRDGKNHNKNTIDITISTKVGHFAIIRFTETTSKATTTHRNAIVANLKNNQSIQLTIVETNSLDEVVDAIMQYVSISKTSLSRYDNDGFIRLTKKERMYCDNDPDFSVIVCDAKSDDEILITLASLFTAFGDRVDIHHTGSTFSVKHEVRVKDGLSIKTALLVCEFLEDLGLPDRLVGAGLGMLTGAVRDQVFR